MHSLGSLHRHWESGKPTISGPSWTSRGPPEVNFCFVNLAGFILILQEIFFVQIHIYWQPSNFLDPLRDSHGIPGPPEGPPLFLLVLLVFISCKYVNLWIVLKSTPWKMLVKINLCEIHSMIFQDPEIITGTTIQLWWSFFATTQRIPRKRLEARVPTQPTTCMVTNLQLPPLG